MSKPINFRATEDELAKIEALRERWECSQTTVFRKAIFLAYAGIFETPTIDEDVASETRDPRIDEILEHVRSIAGVMPRGTLPDCEQSEMILESVMDRKIAERQATRAAGQTFDPRTVPGVQTGAGNLRPRRETGNERAERERRERQERTAALDPVQDESIDRSDEYVSG